MNRRNFIRTIGSASAALATTGAVTTTSTPARGQTIPNPDYDDTCYEDESEVRYPCGNVDAGAEFDEYFIRTWTGEESSKEIEDDTEDFYVSYSWYSYYDDPAVTGTVENMTDIDFEDVYVCAAHYAEDEETVVAEGCESMGRLKAGLEYEYDFYVGTNYAGDYTMFDLWVSSGDGTPIVNPDAGQYNY